MSPKRFPPILLALAMCFTLARGAVAQTAAEHLKALPKPVFKQGNTMIPLTRWGWELAYDAKVELCENWGYALEFGEPRPGIEKTLENPASEQARLVALTKSDPKKYPLSVLVYRALGDPSTLPGGVYPEETFVHDAEGKRLEGVPEWKTWSPLLPDSLYQHAAKLAADPIAALRARAPIAVLLNGGEYGLNCRGHSGPSWEKDPKVVAAKGDKDWDTWIGERKAHYEGFITEAVRKAAPDRQLYLLYHYGSEPGWTDVKWVWDYKSMRKVADMPGQMFYYNRYDNTGWTGERNELSNALCAYAECVPYGDVLAYHWLCAGWEEGKFSDRERYMGFMKSLYNTGVLGNVAGYFSYPKPGFKENLGPDIPPWLWQMIDLAHVQALYSHLEEYLREGELLKGPDKHKYDASLPAYEFPTGDATARVTVRKHKKKDAWLITAWAADGPARKVKVDIPELGEVELEARPAGSVYLATSKVNMQFEPPVVELKLLDPDAMHPSAAFAPK